VRIEQLARRDTVDLVPQHESENTEVHGGYARPAVQLRGATKMYGNVVAVQDVDLEISRGEFFTLLGPSGSGKTTILRMIAGLVDPSDGSILIDGADMAGLQPYERPIAMVFQSLALFPHMDVFGNIAFPLRMRRTGRREIARRVAAALEVVRLPDVAGRKVDQLSGGQQQRVALARALVYEPRLLLLDEPLGALDRRLREEMQLELVRLHQEIDVTIINVTHDQREALMLSDRIGVVSDGAVSQVGPGEELHAHPANRFVASFIGDATLIDGTLRAGSGAAFIAGRDVRLSVADHGIGTGAATLVLRAEIVDLASDRSDLAHCDNTLSGSVEVAVFDGTGYYYEVAVPQLELAVKVAALEARHRSRFSVGEDLWIGWRRDDAPLVGRGHASLR
jgi:ABC-type Fe3+/spermidine/putrescine transport system ATPase subunit